MILRKKAFIDLEYHNDRSIARNTYKKCRFSSKQSAE